MLYEIRVYEAAQGCADAMRERFLNEVAPRMARHGIELLGAFTTPAEDDRLTYITRFADEKARFEGWASFVADPEWQAIKAVSDMNGPLVQKQTVSVLSPAAAGLLLS